VRSDGTVRLNQTKLLRFFLNLTREKGFAILTKLFVKIGITKYFVTTKKCLVLSTRHLVAAAKFLVAATKILSVVSNFVVVTKPFLSPPPSEKGFISV